ncbi:DUF3726 domain-containing protein [Roseovarius indicus]|uniref:DUF3726 domain-containing protein n=1 Tax=Roseovarius indicus TaxID=540747 RepID=A0A0T5P803_9RHOB|nr:DUF3726 domain-containing protein [Roseovarius indicus]KRS17283.1 hypothetical protein XM52_14605 [Roseovarius indicus]QEW27684.1 hypothetical protein RIdsm_03502 [Roseovarius indicus]SFE33181.1 Protein of unknown function [Roseovarius indicus]
MTWSLNEIEALARKAARGGGMDWGPAEETGKATRWLCAAGWPGASALAELLLTQDGVTWEAVRPHTDTDTWAARDGRLCPSAAGAALLDRAEDLASGRTVTLINVARPILLIPYVAWAARATGATLEIRWPGLRVTVADGPCHADISDPTALTVFRADTVTIGPAQAAATGQPVTRVYRGDIPADTAQTLAAFAHRTYAPGTPQSRAAGAGAGLSDND